MPVITINPFTSIDLFSSFQNNEWNSLLKLKGLRLHVLTLWKLVIGVVLLWVSVWSIAVTMDSNTS